MSISENKRLASVAFTVDSQAKHQKTEEKSFLERLSGLPNATIVEIFSLLTGPEISAWNRVSRAANQLFTNNLEGIWQKYWNQKGGIQPIEGKGFTESVQKYRQEFRDLKALIGNYPKEQIPEAIKKIIEDKDGFSVKNTECLRAYCKARDTLIVWDALADGIGATVNFNWSSSASIVTQANQFSDWFLQNEQQLSQLTELDLNYTHCTTLPPEISRLSNLETLYLYGNQLESLPEEIYLLPKLVHLDLHDIRNPLQTLPRGVDRLSKLESLYLSGIGLKAYPVEISRLPSLKLLRLDRNQLESLPPEIGLLTNLTVLYLNGNQLESLPPEICHLTDLTVLKLNKNKLKTLPLEIGNFSKLQKLDLRDNPLQSLPVEFALLPRYMVCRVGNDPVDSDLEVMQILFQ